MGRAGLVGATVALTPNGRIALGSLALLVAGFALGAIDRLAVTNEQALAMLAASATLLLIAGRGRNGNA